METKPGDGSTVALAILMAVQVSPGNKNPQALYVAASYDAAVYFNDLMTQLSMYTGIKTGIVTGDG